MANFLKIWLFQIARQQKQRVQGKSLCKPSPGRIPNDVWQNYTLGAPAVRKIPEGYIIIEMYNTLRNERHRPVHGGVLINHENYWPVKLKHRGSRHIKWVNLHSDKPTVQSIVKETMKNATMSKINNCPK